MSSLWGLSDYEKPSLHTLEAKTLLTFFGSTFAQSTQAERVEVSAKSINIPLSFGANQIGRFREIGKLSKALKKGEKRASAYPKAYTNHTKFLNST